MIDTYVLIYALVTGSAGLATESPRFTTRKACEDAIEQMEKDLVKRNAASTYINRRVEIATATCNPL